jgi:hypothetical protein
MCKSLPQCNMRFEVITRRFHFGFLLLTIMFLACSLFVTVTGKRSTFFSINFVYIDLATPLHLLEYMFISFKKKKYIYIYIYMFIKSLWLIISCELIKFLWFDNYLIYIVFTVQRIEVGREFLFLFFFSPICFFDD